LSAVLYACSKKKDVSVNAIRSPDKPNIILIVGDDIGYEIPTCNGGQSYATPNLDYMAANGMRCTQCYGSPMCSPSRIMLLTGKYSYRNYYSWGILNTDQQTMGNMLQSAGYETLYAGKWQLNGGHTSIKKFGFQNYAVWLPYKIVPEEDAGSRYKSPRIYEDGSFLPFPAVMNKYADDIFTDSIISFISKNQQKPFFIYYAMNLAHTPYSPTPADAAYSSWDGSNTRYSEVKYFPSMVNYLDKKIGEIIDFVKQKNLDENTLVIFMGDNGTGIDINSLFNGRSITGEKGATTTYGTHVPLFFYWPGKILPGSINDNLISFVDFLPTLASVAHVPTPENYGQLDGVNFYSQLTGNNSSARSSIFCQYRFDTTHNQNPARWVQNTQYKLYDTNKNAYHGPGFYNLQNDIEELFPLPDSSLTPAEKVIKQNFRYALDSLN
jgi:arylsulfatase A